MLEMSLLIGNTFVYFMFLGEDEIEKTLRLVTVGKPFEQVRKFSCFKTICSLGVLCGFSIAGTVTFLFLLPTPWINKTEDGKESDVFKHESPLQALKSSFSLFLSPQMLQLLTFFFYMGIQLSFWSGVYGPSLSKVTDFKVRIMLMGAFRSTVFNSYFILGKKIGFFYPGFFT